MPATQELLHQGRYRLDQPLAVSDNLKVFDAYDTISNVKVVVKEITMNAGKVTTLSQQENLRAAFTNQAQALKEMRHDSLLNVEDFFSDVGRHFLVLEAVGGKSLESMIAGGELPVTVDQASVWAEQILNALDFLNARNGMIHGHIDPRSVYLGPDGRVKLLAVEVSDGGELRLNTSLSRDPDSSEYLCYSPIEQIWESLDSASQKVIQNSYDERSEAILLQPPDARSDVYSLGAVLYHLVTGRKPVDALERSIEMLDSKPDPLEAPNKILPEITPEFSLFLLRSLEIRREERYDNAAVMRQALKTAIARAADRENEDREIEEAAKDLKYAVTARTEEVQKAIEAKKRELEAEQEQQRLALEAKLKEVEEQRLEAERRAAEAERLLREQEAAAAETERLLRERSEAAAAEAAKSAAVVEDDVLGISTTEEPVAKPVAVAKAKLDDVHVSAPPAIPAAEEPAVASSVPEPEIIEPAPIVEDFAIAAPEPVIKAAVSEKKASLSDDESVFSYGEKPAKRSMPMAAIAGGVLALVVAVAGIWFFLLRGPATPVAVQTPPVVTQPVAAPSVEQVETSLPEAQTDLNAAVPVGDESATESPAPVQAASTGPATVKPAVKKPTTETAKPKPAPAKKVTVDDLINDN
jgi:serine/threonine protein kinase